jgi:hypothetical protein
MDYAEVSPILPHFDFISAHQLGSQLVELFVECGHDLLIPDPKVSCFQDASAVVNSLDDDRFDSLVELGKCVPVARFGVLELGSESHVFATFTEIPIV